MNLLDETCRARPAACGSSRPRCTDADLARIRAARAPGFQVQTLSMLFDRSQGEAGLEPALDRLCAEAVAGGGQGVRRS